MQIHKKKHYIIFSWKALQDFLWQINNLISIKEKIMALKNKFIYSKIF